MHNPISFYKTDWGEYKSNISAFDGMEPYKGVIYICDGWWRAIELDAVAAFTSGTANETVFVTQYAYVISIMYIEHAIKDTAYIECASIQEANDLARILKNAAQFEQD